MNKEAWQKALAEVTGSPLGFDENDVASINHPSLSLTVNFYYRPDGVVLYTQVGRVNHDQQLRELLSANCMWQQTNGATLSVFEGNQVLLAYLFTAEQALQWAHQYNQFLQAAAFWAEKLISPDGTVLDETASDEAVSAFADLTPSAIASASFV
ncbi:type III secretion system chaperone [Photobacterium kasasachensis]|uniref:type III secretion system chaperone n=1 Tax=Photobacterium kasasachensis TaxID=2910240 RepID=UPI003D0E0FEB